MGKKSDLRPVPKGLAAAVAKAKKHIDKRYVYGLPHYGLNVKMKVELVGGVGEAAKRRPGAQRKGPSRRPR